MIERALVHITGPVGSGKTTLVEQLLRSSTSRPLIAVRCCQDDRLRRARESRTLRQREVTRYSGAGASHSAVYRFPSREAHSDSFFMTDFMSHYSKAVLIEGDRPFEFMDLSVYVTPPPSPGVSLLSRVERDRAAEWAAATEALEQIVQSPDGLEQLFNTLIGLEEGLLASLLPGKEWLPTLRERLLDEIDRKRREPPPKPTQHWVLARGFEGIQHAQVVVINVRKAGQAERAEELRRQVVRLRKDEEVFKDILGWKGSRVPITAVVCDLSDPRHAGTKKAVNRIKRALRRSVRQPVRNPGPRISE